MAARVPEVPNKNVNNWLICVHPKAEATIINGEHSYLFTFSTCMWMWLHDMDDDRAQTSIKAFLFYLSFHRLHTANIGYESRNISSKSIEYERYGSGGALNNLIASQWARKSDGDYLVAHRLQRWLCFSFIISNRSFEHKILNLLFTMEWNASHEFMRIYWFCAICALRSAAQPRTVIDAFIMSVLAKHQR